MMSAPIAEFDLGAHRRQQLTSGFDIANLRNVFERDGFFREQSRRHARKSSVFCSTDANGAKQRGSTADDQFIHDELWSL